MGPKNADTKAQAEKGWLVVLFYSVSTHFKSFNAELDHFDKSFKEFSLVKV